MKKLKAIVDLRCAGAKIKKGKVFEASDNDARVLIAYNYAEYNEEKDKKAAASKKGLSVENSKDIVG